MNNILEFEHNLTKTEVKWGLISLAGGIRKYFPGPNEKIIVYDDEGRKYEAKMHSSSARIDRLTNWYKNHHTVKIGDRVVITINPDKSIKLSLKKEAKIYTEEKREEEQSVLEIVPNIERLLKNFSEKNIEHIEKGLKLYYDKNGISGRQYSTEVGTIDLLCVDNDKNFVVIEFEKGQGSDKTIGQITRYIGWVKKNLASDKEVRGIIIAHKIDEKLEYSASVLNNVDVKYYKIELKFVSKEELL